MNTINAEISSYALHSIKGQILLVKERWNRLDKDSRDMLNPYVENLDNAIKEIDIVERAMVKTLIPVIIQLEKKALAQNIARMQTTKIYDSERT